MDTKKITTTESGNDVKREKVRVAWKFWNNFFLKNNWHTIGTVLAHNWRKTGIDA